MIQSHLFIAIRKLIFPLHKLIHYVPEGKVLDLGCGHGSLSFALAKKYPKTQVIGIDPSAQKIRAAQKIYKHNNLTFYCSTISKLSDKNFQTIIISDVLYLLPYQEKLKIITQVKNKLVKNGTLLIKETKPNLFVKIEEHIMINTLKLTHSNHSKTHFLSPKDYHSLLRKSGFTTQKTRYIKSLLPYRHFLIIAQKKPN